MAILLSKIRLVQFNNDVVIVAPRELSVASCRQWFENTERLDAWDTRILGLTDKNPETGKIYAAEIEALDKEHSDLPLFL